MSLLFAADAIPVIVVEAPEAKALFWGTWLASIVLGVIVAHAKDAKHYALLATFFGNESLDAPR
jgi:uncharacterized membrane protein